MPALLLDVLLHAALGLALAGLVWVVGAGSLVALGRPLGGRSSLDAYPLGLLVVTAAAVLPLFWMPLGAASVAVVACLAWFALRGARRVLPRLPASSVAGSAAFGVGLGLLLHGPSAERGSAAFGGLLWYVDKVVSATQSIVPFRDLLAEGETMIYAEAGTSFVGAALAWIPGFDPILFHAAALPAFAAMSLAVGARLFVDGLDLPSRAGWAATLLAVAAVPYATWVTETPPAAFAVPLVFALWRIWRDEMSTAWLIALTTVVTVNLFLTKVLGVVALGFLLVVGVVERIRHRPDFRRLLATGGGLIALGGAVLIALLFVFASWYAGLSEPKALPYDAVRSLFDGTFDTQSVGRVLLVLGEVAVLALLVRARSWALLLAFGATVALSWFLAGYGFDVALGAEILIVALLVATGELRERRLALAGGALLALSVAFREPLGPQPGVVLALGLALALAGVFVVRRRGVVALAATLAAAALVAVIRSGVDLGDPPSAVTPAEYDVWREVELRVPRDALVFTTQTGLDVTPQQGWNNYPAVAGRQVFIAGWYDGRLVSHPEDRDRKLAENRSVLTGRRRPGELSYSRDFSSYFAVARRSDRVPDTFRRVYANEAYTLYEIP